MMEALLIVILYHNIEITRVHSINECKILKNIVERHHKSYRTLSQNARDNLVLCESVQKLEGVR